MNKILLKLEVEDGKIKEGYRCFYRIKMLSFKEAKKLNGPK